MKKYQDYTNQENVLYVSDKSFRTIVVPLFLIISIWFFVLFVFLLFQLKENFFHEFSFLIILVPVLYILFQEFVLCCKKVVITKNEILIFNFCGKLVNRIDLKEPITVSFNNYVFVIKNKSKKCIKICHEKDNFLIYDILKTNGNACLEGADENFDIFYLKKFYSFTDKLLSIISVILVTISLGYCIFNKNEILSYYYLNKANYYFEKEKLNDKNSVFVNISVDSENLKKCYEYKKMACQIFPNQDKKVYDFIVTYAYIHNLEKDFNEFSHFSKVLYSDSQN